MPCTQGLHLGACIIDFNTSNATITPIDPITCVTGKTLAAQAGDRTDHRPCAGNKTPGLLLSRQGTDTDVILAYRLHQAGGMEGTRGAGQPRAIVVRVKGWAGLLGDCRRLNQPGKSYSCTTKQPWPWQRRRGSQTRPRHTLRSRLNGSCGRAPRGDLTSWELRNQQHQCHYYPY